MNKSPELATLTKIIEQKYLFFHFNVIIYFPENYLKLYLF